MRVYECGRIYGALQVTGIVQGPVGNAQEADHAAEEEDQVRHASGSRCVRGCR